MNTALRKSGLALLLAASFGAFAATQTAEPFFSIPDNVSPQAQAWLAEKQDPNLTPALPAADDRESWRQLQAAMIQAKTAEAAPFVDALSLDISEKVLGAVPVLDIKPDNWQDNGKLIVYTHGGAYTLHSAHSTLASAGLMATSTKTRVLSIDYALAPHSKWQQTTDQVISVFKALIEEGYALEDMAIYGDSAGGGLAAGSVLKMRDLGIGMPAAVVLWSPWSDITDTGDSYATLKHAEPAYTYDKHLKPSADAYADPADQKHPYVSPVYGDYSKGFPPTLIQGGTKEIFLSNFIRHYQALDTAGQIVKLDLYDGMPHVFVPLMIVANAPEGDIAMGKVNDFLNQYLLN